MVQALKTGEIDFVDDIRSLGGGARGRGGHHGAMGVSPSFDEIAFNAGAVDTETGEPIGDGHPALQDPAFRRALAYAVDNDVIVDKVYDGGAVPGLTIIPPFPHLAWEPPEDEAFTFDLERAAELLDEAGYTAGSDGIRTMPDGR